VNLENAPLEGGAVSKNEDRLPIRGYKPALLSASIEEGLLTWIEGAYTV